MKKYTYNDEGSFAGQRWMSPDLPSGTELYVASEADNRIEQLEKALKSCAMVVAMNIKSAESSLNLAAQALNEADKALGITG